MSGTGGPPSRLYTCVYTPNTAKKRKVFKDGYLQCTPIKTTLLSDAQKYLANAMIRLSAPPQEDDEMSVGQYHVIVGTLTTSAEVASTVAQERGGEVTTEDNTLTSNKNRAKKPRQGASDSDEDAMPSTLVRLRASPAPPLSSSTATAAAPSIPAHLKPRPTLHPNVQHQYQPPQHKGPQPHITSGPESSSSPLVPGNPFTTAIPDAVMLNTIQAIPPVKRTLGHPTTIRTSTTKTPTAPVPYTFSPGALVLSESPPVYVPSYLATRLRPHQVEGVRFLYHRLTATATPDTDGSSNPSTAPSPPPSQGALLCDDVGLGKSIQTIAVLEALLNAPRSSIKHAIIVCPATLVNNWHREIKKWLPSYSLHVTVVTAATPAHVIHSFLSSIRSVIMILSYETCRKHASLLHRVPGILVCDEAHRLKSSAVGNKTIQGLKQFRTSKRILLTATPVQNNLDELYAMVDFACPGFLGTPAEFTSRYAQPITRAQDVRWHSDADVIAQGVAKSQELFTLLSRIFLRRTTESISTHLPPKTEFLVFCSPSPLQSLLTRMVIEYYRAQQQRHRKQPEHHPNQRDRHITDKIQNYEDDIISATADAAVGNPPMDILPTLNILRKIATSPLLIDGHQTGRGATPMAMPNNAMNTTLAPTDHLVQHLRSMLASRTNSISSGDRNALIGSKMLLLRTITQHCAPHTNILITSSYTETLDTVETVLRPYTCHRLDGSVPLAKRDEVIRLFNAPYDQYRRLTGGADMHNSHPQQRCILLLSAKAAGAGLNLTNGCVTITCDHNWNPAIDTQVLGRMWRQGQTRPVYIFRLITNGTIDEKICQRQIAKLDVAEGVLGATTDDGDGDALDDTDAFDEDIGPRNGENRNTNVTSLHQGEGNTNSTAITALGKTGGPVNRLTQEEMKAMLCFDPLQWQTYDMLSTQHVAMADPNRDDSESASDNESEEDELVFTNSQITGRRLPTTTLMASVKVHPESDDAHHNNTTKNRRSVNPTGSYSSSTTSSNNNHDMITTPDNTSRASIDPHSALRGGFYCYTGDHLMDIDTSSIFDQPDVHSALPTSQPSPTTMPSLLQPPHVLYCLVKYTNVPPAKQTNSDNQNPKGCDPLSLLAHNTSNLLAAFDADSSPSGDECSS